MSSRWSQEHYLTTSRFAAEAHNGQTIPGTDLPYLLHVSLVAMEVIGALAVESGRDGDLAVMGALLHDVVEDTARTLEDIRARFGNPVAEGVLALTKNTDLPKSEQISDSLQRIRIQPAEIWMIKLADRITNLQPPPANWSAEKIRAYRDDAQEILDTLGAASPHLAERLRAKIAGYAAEESGVRGQRPEKQ